MHEILREQTYSKLVVLTCLMLGFIIIYFADQATLGRDQYSDWKEDGAKWPYWWQALTFQTAGKL